MRKADRFEDKSVFEEGPIYQKMQATLRKAYQTQLTMGNLIAFPD